MALQKIVRIYRLSDKGIGNKQGTNYNGQSMKNIDEYRGLNNHWINNKGTT